jgi:MFS family permease
VAIGAIFLAAAAIEGVMSPVVGRISDRHGRLRPLRAGLAGVAVMALLLPLPESAWVLAATALVAVAALGCFWAPAAALLSDASESEGLDQGFAFGLMNLAWAGGQVIGGAAGGALADAKSDALPYAIVAALCAGSLVLSRSWAMGPTRAPGRA